MSIKFNKRCIRRKKHTVLNNRIDLYFQKYKLAIEVDGLGHSDRNSDYEIQRQQALKDNLIMYSLELILMQ